MEWLGIIVILLILLIVAGSIARFIALTRPRQKEAPATSVRKLVQPSVRIVEADRGLPHWRGVPDDSANEEEADIDVPRAPYPQVKKPLPPQPFPLIERLTAESKALRVEGWQFVFGVCFYIWRIYHGLGTISRDKFQGEGLLRSSLWDLLIGSPSEGTQKGQGLLRKAGVIKGNEITCKSPEEMIVLLEPVLEEYLESLKKERGKTTRKEKERV